MGIPLLVAGVVGAGISAYGKYEEGQATSKAMAYKAQVAENNAAIANRNATMEIQSGEIAAVNQGLKTRSKVGSEKAAQGAGGIDTTTGSAVAVRAGTEEVGMLDALTIRSNAAKRAYTQQIAATSDIAEAQLDTTGAEQAKTAGDIGAAGTLLSGVSTAGGNYAKYQQLYGATGS